MRLLEESMQSKLPVEVCKPEKITVESESVLNVTSLLELGVKSDAPLAVSVWPVATVKPPLAVIRPVEVNA